MAVLALGVMSAQANAASVGLNFSASGVQVVVHDNHKHVNQHKQVNNHKKVVKKHDKHVKHNRFMDRHRMVARRVDDRRNNCCKGKR